MLLSEYMKTTFPHLELKAPLFYSWPIGIRFELGVYLNDEDDRGDYMQEAYRRAIGLFEAVHDMDDEILVVVDVYDYGVFKRFTPKVKVFKRYVKQKAVRFKMTQMIIPFVYPEDDEEGICKTHRFTLKCKREDLKYQALLRAICNQDMGFSPRIYHRVYFINLKKSTIFHVYDDRGCDLLAASSCTIRNIYEQYNDWILDYDRERIDLVFQ